MSKEYKFDFADIEKKIFELEEMIDESRFTAVELTTKYGYTFKITHPKRERHFLETHEIKKFLPQKTQTQERTS